METKKLYGAQIGSSVPNWGKKEIDNCEYQYRHDFIALKFNDNLEKIGRYAFGRCTDLVSVDMPDSINELGEGVFFGCKKLEYVKLSNSLTIIPKSCFANCVSIKEIYIPYSVKEIEPYAFGGCKNLEKIYIPMTTHIGEHALPNNFKYMYASKQDNQIIFSKEIITDIDIKKYKNVKNNLDSILCKDEFVDIKKIKNDKKILQKSQKNEEICEK